MIARRLVGGAVLLFLAVLAIRNAAVHALVGPSLDSAQAMWPTHPDVEIAKAQRDIAIAAGARREVPQAAFAQLADAAAKAPLEPEPFLVHGIRAELANRHVDADAAFLAARQRDPRSLPARYFLASSRLRRGELSGLHEAAAMARLVPGGATAVAPYLASVARQEKSWSAIRTLFQAYPDVRDHVLASLARDRAHLPQVLALGGVAPVERAPWIGVMIETLVEAGDYGRARMLWARSSGIDPARLPLLYDPAFRDAGPPPPFNWLLTSSTVGLAERQSGRLHVIFYGLEDGPLASQLLLLSPGRYRLSAAAGNGSGEDSQLWWSVRCDGTGGRELAAAPVKAQGLNFSVERGCAAQRLELLGRSADVGTKSELTVGPLALSRVGGSGQ